MRELKFRAWGKNIKEYMSQSFDGEVEIANVTRILGDLIDQGSWIIEQYTGLTDKNGKEIYEGDVVKEDIEVGDDDIDGEYIYQVVWDEETLCWSLSPNYGVIHKDLWETNLSREVIGNIHEPPKDFRPEHLKCMGISISKGGEE